jgi:hypothetical protein
VGLLFELGKELAFRTGATPACAAAQNDYLEAVAKGAAIARENVSFADQEGVTPV